MFIKQKISLTTIGAALISLGTVGQATAASFYSISDLGTLPNSSFSYATDVNKFGQVVGYSGNDYNSSHAFFWENGVLTDIGTLGGGGSLGWGINNSAQVVGAAQTRDVTYDGFPISHSLIWSKRAGISDLTPGTNLNTSAEKINDAGQVIGSTENGDAFLFEHGVTTNICQSGQPCSAYGINNSGQVVGNRQVVLGTQCFYPEYSGRDCNNITADHAYLWNNGKITNLGTIGDAQNSSYAFAINDVGQIVGEADFRAVLWENGKITDLGTLGGRGRTALAINNLGQVVGRAATTGYYEDLHAFLWDRTNGIQDLNSLITAKSGWLLSEARGINSNGQIVGSGTINGQQHAFLLTPKPIPESASGLGILAFGAIGAGYGLWRKQTLASGKTNTRS